jgi:hypothetical protein
MSVTKHLTAILLLVAGVPMLRVYSQPISPVLHDTTIATAANFPAYNSITAGPNFTIAATGDVTLRTGGPSYFMPRIVIIQGGRLRTISDPTLVSVRALEAPLPAEFRLDQNYPNPFNPLTYIRFAVKKKSHVSLIVYNLLGQPVATVVNEDLQAGEYEAPFSSNGLASGVYVYRMTTNRFVESRRMLLLK